MKPLGKIKMEGTAPPGGEDWKVAAPPAEARENRSTFRGALEVLKDVPQWGERRPEHAQGNNTGLHNVPGEQDGSCPPTIQMRRNGPFRGQQRRRAHSGSQPVTSKKGGSLSKEKGREPKARSPAPSGVQVPAQACSSSSSTSYRIMSSRGVSPQAPVAPRGVAEFQGQGRAHNVAIVSLCRLNMGHSLCTHTVWRGVSSPVCAVTCKARVLSSEAQHAGLGPQVAASPQGLAFPHSVKGLGLVASSILSKEGEAASSKSPGPELYQSLRIAQRKRKLQGQGLEKSLPAPRAATLGKAMTKPQRAGTAANGPAIGLGSTHAHTHIVRGTLVWYKCGDLPYWPAVVCSVTISEETARVLLIEANLCVARSGIRVPLHRLKPLDCEEKSKLQRRASRAFGPSITWCLSLVAHYREGLALRSFKGSFLEYYASEASYPLRRALREGEPSPALHFPEVNYSDLEDSDEESSLTPTGSLSSSGSQGAKGPRRRLLPDRTRGAQDRTNQKLVDFIVKTKGADGHLLDIMQGKKPSRWLAAFLREDRYLVSMETYLEDDDQLDVVARHLQQVFERTENPMQALLCVDKVRLVLEVLLPEAMICSIAALEGLDHQDAEEKYLRGPPVRTREKDLFDRKICRERRKRSAGSRQGLSACRRRIT